MLLSSFLLRPILIGLVGAVILSFITSIFENHKKNNISEARRVHQKVESEERTKRIIAEKQAKAERILAEEQCVFTEEEPQIHKADEAN